LLAEANIIEQLCFQEFLFLKIHHYLIFLYIMGYNNISWRPHVAHDSLQPPSQELSCRDTHNPQDLHLCRVAPSCLLGLTP